MSPLLWATSSLKNHYEHPKIVQLTKIAQIWSPCLGFVLLAEVCPCIDIRELIDCSLVWPCAMFWLSRYVASHHLAVAPQSNFKDQFYFTAYYTTFNWNCEAQRIKKNGKMLRLKAKINARVIWVYFFFSRKEVCKNQSINQINRVLCKN